MYEYVHKAKQTDNRRRKTSTVYKLHDIVNNRRNLAKIRPYICYSGKKNWRKDRQ